jgi:hypothetical protein
MNDIAEPFVGPNAAARGCPPPEQIIALLGEGLPSDLRQAIVAHVERCAACRRLAADLALLAEVEPPGSLDARVLDASTSTRARWALVAAAVILAAIGLSTWWRVRAPEGPAPARVASSAATTRPSSAAAVSVPQAGGWKIDKPSIVLPVATAIIMRGADSSGGAALLTALEPYRHNDFSAAAARLQAFTAAQPGSSDGWFYLGASRLLAGDAVGARAALDEADRLHAAERHPEIEWLLATALARAGDISAARRRLETICEESSPLRDRACQAAQSLGGVR